LTIQRLVVHILSYGSVEIGSSLDKSAHGEIVDAADGDTSSEYNCVEDLETYRTRLVDISFLDDLGILKSWNSMITSKKRSTATNKRTVGNDEASSTNNEESTVTSNGLIHCDFQDSLFYHVQKKRAFRTRISDQHWAPIEARKVHHSRRYTGIPKGECIYNKKRYCLLYILYINSMT
jgi:hypothetical protein